MCCLPSRILRPRSHSRFGHLRAPGDLKMIDRCDRFAIEPTYHSIGVRRRQRYWPHSGQLCIE